MRSSVRLFESFSRCQENTLELLSIPRVFSFIARILRKKHGLIVRDDILLRKSSGQQKKLSRDERLGAAGAVYDLRPEFRNLERFQDIPTEAVLLDDIVTTGATMEKCAWLLKSAGVQKVYGLALFRVG